MRRNRYEICADILRATLSGSKKTRLVYATNLNFNLVNKYLPRLMERGFIEATEDGYYITTPKGAQFLKEYDDLVELMKADDGDTHEFLVHAQESKPGESQAGGHPVP